MEKEEFIKELKYILIRSLVIDAVVLLVSALIFGHPLLMAAVLIAATAGMLINFFLLNRSVYRIVRYGNGAKASGKMFVGYLLRLAITGAVVAAAMLIRTECAVCAVLPFLYPSMIYSAGAFFRKEKKDK